MPRQTKKTELKPDNSSEEKLKTDEPLSERDEVKQAEERTRKAQKKINPAEDKSSK